MDSYRGEVYEHGFLNYCLFVTFFPRLIAGPIVHHKEMLPQFCNPVIFRFSHDKLAVELTLFAIGLFKKVVLANGMAVYASPAFAAVSLDHNFAHLIQSRRRRAAPLQNMVLRAQIYMGRPALGGFVIKAAAAAHGTSLSFGEAWGGAWAPGPISCNCILS